MELRRLLLLIMFSTQIALGQNEKSGIQMHSASIGMGVAFGNGNFDNYGASFNLDVAVNKEEHIFRAFIFTSIEGFGFLTDDPYATEEYDLLYGREFGIGGKFYTDAYAGVGLFIYDESRGQLERVRLSTIGFPLLARLRFQAGNTVGLGLQFHSNINSGKTIYGGGLFVQFKF